jgi:hypothetical protein
MTFMNRYSKFNEGEVIPKWTEDITSSKIPAIRQIEELI